MSYQQRDMSGQLFKNDKGDNPKRPDYRGSITIGGVEYELAAWIKEGQRGKFMSLNAKVKEARQEKPQTISNNMQPDEFDDSLPF